MHQTVQFDPTVETVRTRPVKGGDYREGAIVGTGNEPQAWWGVWIDREAVTGYQKDRAVWKAPQRATKLVGCNEKITASGVDGQKSSIEYFLWENL